MPSDYPAITAHNERQLGLDTASRKTQIGMYSDSTHFVYEILQNADDHGASMVSFILAPDALTIEHDGQPFSPDNVKAITYFGKSTSRDDLVKTGRFGVGFKSVFAFTATPTILSGEEHFQIHGLYRLREAPYPADFNTAHTRIILPFNHVQEKPDFVDELVPAEDAHAKIAARLTGLSMNTLLFTRNVREIQWRTPHAHGHYLREDQNADGYRWTTTTDGENRREFLVFSRTPTWRSQEFKPVEIAFGLDGKGQVSSIEDYLYVLFATTQETHLLFLLNGPYRTNPSRETIAEDDPFNRHLMAETAGLLRDVLPRLRDMKLLTSGFLGVLPNNADKLREFYIPIREACVSAFRDFDLVPTDNNNFAPAKNVIQGPKRLRALLGVERLAFFTGGSSSRWAIGCMQNSREEQFLRTLAIREWSWSQFVGALCLRFAAAENVLLAEHLQWLATQDDKWLQSLYLALLSAIDSEEIQDYEISDCNIVALEDGTFTAGSQAFFPHAAQRDDLKGMPTVKRSLLAGSKATAERIKRLLAALGVREIDEEQEIRILLKRWYTHDSPKPSEKDHLAHMRQFIHYLTKQQSWQMSTAASVFKESYVFRDATSKWFVKPSGCLIDVPFANTGLSQLLALKIEGYTHYHALWAGYATLQDAEFATFAEQVGAITRIPITTTSTSYHPARETLRAALGEYGTRRTGYECDEDFTIANLDELLRRKDQDLSRLLWNTMCAAERTVLHARYRPNASAGTKSADSTLVLRLRGTDWIPDKSGVFRKPSDMQQDQCLDGFPYNDTNGWLTAVHFGLNAKRRTVEHTLRQEVFKSIGIPAEFLLELETLTPDDRRSVASKLPEVLRAIVARVRDHRAEERLQPTEYGARLADRLSKGTAHVTGQGAVVPPLPVPDVERRRQRETQGLDDDIAAEPHPSERFSLLPRKVWDRKDCEVRQFLLEQYAGKCQICQDGFVKHTGGPYFVALYLIHHTEAKWAGRSGNVLCLCATCAAKLQHGSVNANDIEGQILGQHLSREGGCGPLALSLTLCGAPATISFTERHFLALQEIVRKGH